MTPAMRSAIAASMHADELRNTRRKRLLGFFLFLGTTTVAGWYSMNKEGL